MMQSLALMKIPVKCHGRQRPSRRQYDVPSGVQLMVDEQTSR